MLFRKKIIALLFLIIVSGLYGQQRFGGALLIGANASQLDGDEAAGFRKFGICGGLRGIAKLGEKSDLLIDLMYSQRGSKAGYSDFVANIQQKISLNYIEIPVTLQYSDWLYETPNGTTYYKMKINGGLSIGRLLSAEAIYTNGFDNKTDLFNKTDISWVVGVSYFMNPDLFFTGRYTASLNNLFDNKDSGFLTNSLKGYFFNLSLGYKL